MKKKIVALCLVLALALTAIGGATLAYFTDFETETNEFVVGNVDIELNENGFKDGAVLLPGVQNAVEKKVTVKNIGESAAYLWIEVWVPAALDDGDGNSPDAPGLGNSLHFNYTGAEVVETKATFLGSKFIGDVKYNGYVHYAKDGKAIDPAGESVALLNKVYMDKDCTQCTEHDDCMILMKGDAHYTDEWDVVVNAVGFQAAGFTQDAAIAEYYGKPLEIW